MEQVYVVRHKVLVEGQPIRKVAREMRVSRQAIRRYVSGAEVEVRKAMLRASPKREKVGPRLEQILNESPRWTAGKQRLTAARLHRMLVEEGLSISRRTVETMVAEWKRRRQEVYVPLMYEPGDLAEVDFFEVVADVNGERRKAWMFVMRLMHSGRDFAWLYPRQDQTCFLDGHVKAFAHFEAVPHRIVYDNLKAAVSRILIGSERELSTRFLALANHYLFEASFARPRTGHDKGGVEARGKGIRWQHLVPIPVGRDLECISGALLAGLSRRMSEERNAAGQSVAERFSNEAPRMIPRAEPPFRSAAMDHAEVSRRSLVHVGGARYSVWCDWARLSVKAYLGVNTVELVGPDGRTVAHPRKPKGETSIDYRHYLPELAKKPQAVRQVAAGLVRDLGAPYDFLWRELVDEHGPKQAARVFAKVLQAIREQGESVTSERIQLALTQGESVLFALKPSRPTSPELATESLPPCLQKVEVLSGSAKDYDDLLGGAR